MGYIQPILLTIALVVLAVLPTTLYIVLTVKFKKLLSSCSFVLFATSTFIVVFLTVLNISSLIFPVLNSDNLQLITDFTLYSSAIGAVSRYLLVILLGVLLFQLKPFTY